MQNPDNTRKVEESLLNWDRPWPKFLRFLKWCLFKEKNDDR